MVLPIIISLLFPLLFDSKAKRNHSAHETSKNTVFGFFSGLNSDELIILLDLLFFTYNMPVITLDDVGKPSTVLTIAKINK